MYLLTDGRGPFLDFLRNLTPQALLLSLAFISGSKLDLSTFDLSNWAATFVFVMFLVMAVLAGFANASLFLGRFTPITHVRRVFNRLDPRRHRGIRLKAWYAYRKKWVFLEATFILFSVEAGIAVVFFTAMKTAETFVGK